MYLATQTAITSADRAIHLHLDLGSELPIRRHCSASGTPYVEHVRCSEVVASVAFLDGDVEVAIFSAKDSVLGSCLAIQRGSLDLDSALALVDIEVRLA